MSEFLEATIDKFIIRVKNDLRYSSDHVWVSEGDQYCTLGLTDYAQRRGGDVVFFEFTMDEGVVDEGEPVALYETIKAALDVRSPFDCVVVELNHKLEERPELVNEDPYIEGWVARVRPVEQGSLDALLTPEEYLRLMEAEAQLSISRRVNDV